MRGQPPSHLILGLVRDTNTLVLFDSATPGSPITTVPVTGLVAGDTLRAIDIRPANGRLYGLGVAGHTQVRLYTIAVTAAATPVGGVVPGLTASSFWGLSFSAVADRIRIVNSFDVNIRLNPDTGALAASDPALTPASVVVESVAYDNQIRGATSTTLFTLDLSVNGFARIGGPGGVPSANSGIVTPIGAVGTTFGGFATGLDVAANGTVYAALRPAATSQLYTINRVTGLGTLVGAIGTTPVHVDNLTILEPPLGIAESYSTPFGAPLIVAAPGLLQNDSDSDNSPLTAVLQTAPAQGSVSLAVDGSFTYTPNAGYAGSDSFTYLPFDGLLNGGPIAVSLTIAANQPPVVAPPANQSAIDSGSGTTIGPLAFSVADPEGASVSLTASSSDPAIVDQAGLVLGGSGSSRTITIASVAGTSGGTATITLNGSDGYATGSATFTVTITPLRGRPLGLTNASARNNASLQWQAPPFSSEPVTGYVLEAGTSPGTTMVSMPVGTTSFATTAPDGIYYVRVRSQTAGGLSASSNEVVVALGQAVAPLAPLALLATVQGNSVSLQWTENPAGAVIASYQLSVGSTPGASNLIVLPVSAAARTYAASGPSGTYYLRVTAVNAAGASGPSNEATLVLAPGACTVPATPIGLLATVAPGSVTLRWTAPSSGPIPSTYRLEAGSAPGASNVGVFALPQSSAVSSPAPAGTYFVRLAASNVCGTSPPAAELTFTVP